LTVEQNTFCQRSLTRVDVGRDTDVSGSCHQFH